MFIPGSAPVTGDKDAISFDTLLIDLDLTQEQLLLGLDRASSKDLGRIKDDQTIGEHLVIYQTHESYHLGQLETLCQSKKH